jgi:uncharacterized repeat protein (TIGR01451 family)
VQDPRPDRDGSSGGGGGTGNGGDGDGGDSGAVGPALACASLVGQVINWGFGGEGGVTTDLDAGSWQLSTVSATDGNYGFGGLGVGAAELHIALSPEQAERFQPLIQDAGVYLNCDFPIVANIAVYSGEPITPPATIEMAASRTSLSAGQQADITLIINNGLPNDITNVVVTDLFPPGLIPVDVSTDAAGAEAIKIVDTFDGGKLTVVNLNTMAAGAQATINISVAADPTTALTPQLNSTATLFYRESAAHQASVEFSIEAGAVSLPLAEATSIPTEADAFTSPESPSETSEATDADTDVETSDVVAEEADDGEDFVPPNGLPKTGDNFVPDNFMPPPIMLPVTGQETAIIPDQLSNIGFTEFSWVLTFVSLALAGLVIVALRLRGSRRNKKNKQTPENVDHQSIDDLGLDFSPLRHPHPHTPPSQNKK